MEELTEVGLQNFFSLFLLLAAVAEVEDVAYRLDSCPKNKMDPLTQIYMIFLRA